MSPDIEKYRRHVDQFDLTEKQKVELIYMVWRMMQSFVDQAFALDPVQQVKLPAPQQDENQRDDVVDCSCREVTNKTPALKCRK